MEKIIRERLKPRIYDYTYLMTRSYRRTIENFRRLVLEKKHKPMVLDIGCGEKPFRSLFPKTCRYVGVDLNPDTAADVIADIHHLPFANNSFDAVVASEILEHSHNEYQAVAELRRVVKKGGLVFVSIPFIFPEHGQPEDFHRLTQFKLKNLFNRDKVILLKPTNGLFASVFIFMNTVVRTYCGGSILLAPIYVVNNVLALLVEGLAPIFTFINRQGFESGPAGYSLIVRIKK